MAFKHSGTIVITDDRLVQLTTGNDAARPSSPSPGTLFYNTSSGKIEVYNGSTWKAGIRIPAVEVPSLWVWGSTPLNSFQISSPISIAGVLNDWKELSNKGIRTIIRSNGTAWSVGTNDKGELGNNKSNFINYSSPVSIVGGFTDWIQASAGQQHSLGLRANGTLWAWGSNFRGYLGDGTTTSRSSPVSVAGEFTDWIFASAALDTSFGIRADGSAWAWGSGRYGSKGDNSSTSRSSPSSVVGGINWIQISSNGDTSVGISSSGIAWSWGRNYQGSLGRNDSTSISVSSPVSVVGGFTDWTQVECRSSQTVGVRANGTLWSWGVNSHGNLGDNSTVHKSSPVSVLGGFTDWTQVASSGSSNFGIRANGTLWAWGYNGYGELGQNIQGLSARRSSPMSVLGNLTDWVQVTASTNDVAAIRSQPLTQTIRPGNQRNRF